GLVEPQVSAGIRTANVDPVERRLRLRSAGEKERTRSREQRQTRACHRKISCVDVEVTPGKSDQFPRRPAACPATKGRRLRQVQTFARPTNSRVYLIARRRDRAP